MKTAFIIPGFRESTKSSKYKRIGNYFKDKEIKPVFVEVQWKRSVMSDYVEQFLKLYNNHKSSENYFLGFSYGAMICFIASTQTDVNSQVLCSLSPYFAEDVSNLKKWWIRSIGKNRVIDFERIQSSDLIKHVKARTILIAGEKEPTELIKSNDRIYSHLACQKERYIIPNAKHDIGNSDYQNQIELIIKTL